jgi:hypothetical protein
MEEKTPSAGQSALIYALLLSGAMIVIHLILYLVDMQTETVGIVISVVVIIAGIVLVQLDYKKKLGGFISYGQAVKIAFLSMLFAGFVMAAYTFVYHSYINTSELQETKLERIQEIYNNEMDAESEATAINMIEYMVNPVSAAISAIISNALFGIIIALITGIFIKKDENVSLS